MILLKKSSPKAIKDHVCDYCCLKISKGDIYERATIVGECNDLYDWVNHTDCGWIANKLKMFDECDGEGLTGDVFMEIIGDEFFDLTGEIRSCKVTPFQAKLMTVIEHHL